VEEGAREVRGGQKGGGELVDVRGREQCTRIRQPMLFRSLRMVATRMSLTADIAHSGYGGRGEQGVAEGGQPVEKTVKARSPSGCG
jgi:hypothetical protein